MRVVLFRARIPSRNNRYRSVFCSGITMKLRSIMTCLVAAGAPSVYAQDNIQLAEAYVPGLGDEIVVTAARAPQTLKDTLASTTVITREQIEKTQARDVYQLLRTVPGVYLRRNGGRGSSTSISLRGGNASGTLVLLDGVNIESATLGQVSLEQLAIDQIDRIEILRGPKSSLYGSTAMNGVVHIFTRKGADKNTVTYSLGAGTHDTRDGSVSVSGSSASARYNLTASHVTSTGYDTGNSDDALNVSDAIRYDDDAYRRSAFSLNLEQDLGEYLTANLLVNRAQGENEYDSAYSASLPYLTYETLLTATSLTFDNGALRSRLQYGQLVDHGEQLDDIDLSQDTFIETKRTTGLWENSVAAADELMVNFGMDYSHEEVDKTVPFGIDKRDNFGGYVNTRLDIDLFSWTLGFRHDNNEQFGSKWTGDTAFGYEFMDGVTASIAYGTAFKAPSFNDLYWPASAYSAGNPDLVPEEAENYEIGIDAYRDWGMASVHIYKSYVENMIDWAETSPWFWQPSNVGEVKIRGAEFQYGTHWLDVDWKTSFTYEKVTDANSGEELIRKPRRRLALDMDKALGEFSVGATVYAQSGGLDTVNAVDQRLAGYGLVDLRAAWQVTPELVLRTRIDNVLDKDYEEIIGYNNEGRFYMFFVDYTPR